ncbi:hypothetical protein PTKIN_Ptkin11bG0188700 [Pterospermum kingtungense]
MPCEFLTSALSNAVGNLVVLLFKPAIRRVRYIFYFNKIVEELSKESRGLALAQERVQHEVESALRQTQEIEMEVRNWLAEVGDILGDVESLEYEIQEETKRSFSWRRRYGLSKKLVKKMVAISKLVETSKFGQVSYQKPQILGIEFFSSKEFLPSKSSNLASNKIMEALDDDDVNLIAVWGMGGVGKTTLVQEVGKKAKELDLFDQVVMAVVSQNPIIEKIQDKIADFLDLKFEKMTEEGRAAQLWLRLKNEKRVLVILDDVWNELNLKALGVPFGEDHKGCKVLLTTRRQHVCHSMRCNIMVPLDVLDENEALVLFEMNADLNLSSPTIKEIAVEVAKECEGLPIAIVTLGRTLRGRTLNEWKAACQKRKRSRLLDIECVEEEKNAYKCLQLSYDHLRGEDSKICFLLCALFPEDCEIDEEELVRYAWALGLYQGVYSIDEARSETWAALDNLKASCLLIDCGEGFVKMHDMVRDVALWMVSRKENGFMMKSEVGLKEWPKNEHFEPCRAVSLTASKLQEFPAGLVCPNLEILLLGGDNPMTISSTSFKGMKAIKAITLCSMILAPNVLQFPSNLRTLSLKHCELSDISSLGKLRSLEMLSFYECNIEELPDEIRELNNLKLLDLSSCWNMTRIPPNLIGRLSQLEELYLGYSSFTDWKIVGTNGEVNNASLSELNSLPRLAVLSLRVHSLTFPDGFVFPKLKRYDIAVNEYCSNNHPTPRSLKIKAVSLHAFKELFWNIEYISLNSIVGCQNLVPTLDPAGLAKLISLTVTGCDEMECLIDTKRQELMNPSLVCAKLTSLKINGCSRLEYLFPISLVEVLSQLKVLHLVNLSQLKQVLCPLKQTDGNDIVLTLPSLQDLKVTNCPQLAAFIIRSQIKELTISELGGGNRFGKTIVSQWKQKLPNNIEYLSVGNFEEAFQLQVGDILTCLKVLKLEDLPELRLIWKGPIQVATLQNLTELVLIDCKRLRYIFPPVFATTLSQLITLRVEGCEELQQIIDKEDQISASSSSSFRSCFQNLTYITIKRCHNLKSLFLVNVARFLQKLACLCVEEAFKLEQVFADEDEDDSIVKYGKEMVLLPQLKILTLERLPSLMRFSPVGYRFIFPSLDFLLVTECPEVTTTFSLDPKLFVHAKTEVSQSFDKDMQEDSAKDEEISWPIGGDIDWCRSSQQGVDGCNLIIAKALMSVE